MRTAAGRYRVATGRMAGAFATMPALLARTGPALAASHRSGQPRVGTADGGEVAWPTRALQTLAGVFVVTWSFRLSGYLTFAPWLAIPVAVLGLTGLLVIIAAWLPDSVLGSRGQAPDRLGRAGRGARRAGPVELLPGLHRSRLRYRRDRLRPVRGAAGAARHSIRTCTPWRPAFPLFHVSPNGYTFQLNGQPVTTLSYPALSFEAYLPLLAARSHHPGGGLDRRRRLGAGRGDPLRRAAAAAGPLAAVVASLDVYIGYAVGGVTDSLFVPLLVGAAVRLGPVRLGPRPGRLAGARPAWGSPWRSSRPRGWWSRSCWRASCWSRGAGEAGARRSVMACAMLGIATGAFLVPNLPYLITAPGAWLHGVLTPFSSQSVPAGQGLISLSLSLPVGGGSLLAYSIVAAVIFIALRSPAMWPPTRR